MCAAPHGMRIVGCVFYIALENLRGWDMCRETLVRPALFTQSEGALRGKSGGGDVCTCNILFIYTTHGMNVV